MAEDQYRKWYSGNNKTGLNNKKARKDVIDDLIEENNKKVDDQKNVTQNTGTVPQIVVTGTHCENDMELGTKDM